MGWMSEEREIFLQLFCMRLNEGRVVPTVGSRRSGGERTIGSEAKYPKQIILITLIRRKWNKERPS